MQGRKKHSAASIFVTLNIYYIKNIYYRQVVKRFLDIDTILINFFVNKDETMVQYLRRSKEHLKLSLTDLLYIWSFCVDEAGKM